MNVLIGCEESGAVRDAFLALGHKVLSCDIQPTRSEGPHYCGDLFDVIDYPWDLAIFHPPCTHTSVSGAKHFAAKWNDGRQAAGVSFVMKIKRRSAHIPQVCIEQPVSVMSNFIDWPRQTVQPYQFGHGETKATVLYLKNLPTLVPTNIVDGREARIHRMAPSETRARDRSTTYPGIAQAMADQWGNL